MVLGLLLLTPAPGLAQVAKPDLVVTSLTPPPTSGLPGDSFVVTAGVKNNGAGVAGSSATKFYLVSTSGVAKNLKGVQAVDPLGPGASTAPPALVTIYSDTVPGTYSLLACANRGETKVSETNELNNCLTVAGSITVHDVPDLAVMALSNPPASVPQGQAFQLASYTVKNQGLVPAAAVPPLKLTMKFYLVSNADGTRIDLKASAVALELPSFAPKQVFTATNTKLTVRAETLPGSYGLQACADSGKAVLESDENDNCLLAATSVQVTPQPDLIVNKVTVTGDPLTVKQGDPVTMSVVVKNQGLLDAGASTMKFILVPAAGTPTKNMKGEQAVPPVPQGTKVTVGATVNVYDDTVPGVYTVQACVDYDRVVGESSDGNNCTAAPGPITVTGVPLSPADLTVVSLTEPPASAFPGDTLQLTAGVKNLGTGPSDPTVTGFYLVNAAGTLRKNLKGVQSVAAVAAGATTALPTAPIALYSDTVAGSYFLQACADDDKQLAERNEGNNCKTSAGMITVQQVPDLAMTAIGNPPANVVAGQILVPVTSYSVTNTGAVSAPASATKFYLVSAVDATRVDLKGMVPEDLAVPALAPAQVFNHSVSLKVRANTPPGSYTLLGCADSGKVVAESDEDDNCKASATAVQVAGLPDLVVNAVRLAAPSVTVSRGGTLPITVVVKNQGFANAGASTIKLLLVVAPGTAAPTKTLPESPAVPAVAQAGKQTVVPTATIPSSTPPGTYVVQACVDAVKLVPEFSDENNCGTSVDTIKVQ